MLTDRCLQVSTLLQGDFSLEQGFFNILMLRPLSKLTHENCFIGICSLFICDKVFNHTCRTDYLVLMRNFLWRSALGCLICLSKTQTVSQIDTEALRYLLTIYLNIFGSWTLKDFETLSSSCDVLNSLPFEFTLFQKNF